jgi:hypothetical protein
LSTRDHEKPSGQGAEARPIENVIRRQAEAWRAAPPPQKHDALLQGRDLARAKALARTARIGLSRNEIDFIEASLRRARGRAGLVSGLSGAILLLIGAVVAPRVYAEYARRLALDCDLHAAEEGSSLRVPGVPLEAIVPDVAIPSCEQAIAADPENPRLMHNLGRAFDKAGRTGDAVYWYRHSAERDYDWAQTTLGVMYVHGRGVTQDIAQGIALLRAAVVKDNPAALVYYKATNFSAWFEGSPERARILEAALRDRGFLDGKDVTGEFGPKARQALAAYKQKAGFPEPWISLRVIDELGIAARLQAKGASNDAGRQAIRPRA